MVDLEVLVFEQNLGKVLKKDLKEKIKIKKLGIKIKLFLFVKKSDGKFKFLVVLLKLVGLKEFLDKVFRVVFFKKKEFVEKVVKFIIIFEVKVVCGEEKDKEIKNVVNVFVFKLVKIVIVGLGIIKVIKFFIVFLGFFVYLDLCYIFNYSNSKNVDVEFFKRVWFFYYVVSGNDFVVEEFSWVVLDVLLEGKVQWGSNMQVILILIYDLEVMREWYQEIYEKQ